MTTKSKKKTWLAVVLNFFIWGVGYIYLGKKIGYGIFLLILDIILILLAYSNAQLIYDVAWNVVALIPSINFALDAYFISKKLKRFKNKFWDKLTDVLVVILILFLLLYASVLSAFSNVITLNGENTLLEDLKLKSKTVSIYIDSLPYGIDQKYQNSLREAISFWEKRADVTFREVDLENPADIKVSWVKEFGGKTLGHTVYTDFIEIGLGDSICLQKWKVYNYDTVLDIAIHELGHALGYDDDYNNENSVMYYSLTTKYEIDIEETDAIPDGWARFYPVCTKRSSAKYTFEITSSEPLDIYVVPSTEEFELIKKNEKFSHYLNCQENNVRTYRKTCTVSQDSGIVLKNPSILGLGQSARFSIEIIES